MRPQSGNTQDNWWTIEILDDTDTVLRHTSLYYNLYALGIVRTPKDPFTTYNQNKASTSASSSLDWEQPLDYVISGRVVTVHR